MEPRNNIIAFTGNLPRTIYRAILQWKKLFQNKYGDYGISQISLGTFSPEALKAELETPPFLIKKKMVIISIKIEGNIGELGKYIDVTYWENIFQNIPDETTVLIYGFKPKELENTKKTYNKTKKSPIGKTKKNPTVSQDEINLLLLDLISQYGKEKKYELLKESDFKKYILDQLSGISIQNAELLQKRLGNSPESLENEVQKLSLINEGITSEIIIENTRENTESSVFEMFDMLIAENTTKAYDLAKKHISHEDSIQVLRGYLSALRKPALYCSLLLNGKTAAIALQISGIHEYAAKKYFSLNKFKKRAIVNFYLGCIKIDTQGKTGKLIGDVDGYEHGILKEILQFSKE